MAKKSNFSHDPVDFTPRSEEHTSELQSLTNLVCRLLLEKKKKIYYITSLRFIKATPYVYITFARFTHRHTI